MAYKFNPFTLKLDQVGAGGSGFNNHFTVGGFLFDSPTHTWIITIDDTGALTSTMVPETNAAIPMGMFPLTITYPS